MDMIWYRYTRHTYLQLHTSKLKVLLLPLSKSINGSRKSTETSVKIIFENIKNRNRDR